jgi:hypothetical protein
VLPVSGFREKLVALRLSTFATQSANRVTSHCGKTGSLFATITMMA